MTALKRWRGLSALVQDLVEHGSRGIERIQKETVRRPLALVGMVPALETPARAVRAIHDVAVTSVHASIRLAASIVGGAVAGALDAVDERRARQEPPPGPPAIGS